MKIRFFDTKSTQKELLVMRFEIPEEPKKEINFDGFCQCDRCREYPEDAVRLSKGKTVFLLDNRLIYCGCLPDYLKSRMTLLR